MTAPASSSPAGAPDRASVEFGFDPVPGVRARVLRDLGASESEVEELLRYNENLFRVPDPLPPFPLPDEPFVEAWEEYAREAAACGVFPVLRDALVQLRFPVAPGIAETEGYRAATRRGVLPPDGAPGLALEAPERLRLFLHPTAAGRLPVLVAGARADFVALVRALARKGEPEPVPDSMGALVVGGYVNWGRVARLRAAWEAGDVDLGEMTEWSLGAIRDRKELYQDRFVVLSDGPYSGVAAAAMGMPDDEWRRLSLTLRLEHECAHYFTRRVLGSMRNALHDELIADYCGISAAAGRFRADWFLRFLGLERPTYRAGGRLEVYRGTPPLSAGAFAVLQRLVRRAAARLEAADAQLGPGFRTTEGRARVVLALAGLALEALAGGADQLRALLTSCRS
ncbi:MAG: DUF7005 family protein [Longimicrobiaceae bacterium]